MQDIHGEIWPNGLVAEAPNVAPTGFCSSYSWQGDYWLAGFRQLKSEMDSKKKQISNAMYVLCSLV